MCVRVGAVCLSQCVPVCACFAGVRTSVRAVRQCVPCVRVRVCVCVPACALKSRHCE